MASSVSGIEVFLPYSLSLPFSYSSSPLPYSLHIHSIIMFIKSNNPIISENRPDRDARPIDRCSHDGCQGLEGASSTPHYQYFFLTEDFFFFSHQHHHMHYHYCNPQSDDEDQHIDDCHFQLKHHDS